MQIAGNKCRVCHQNIVLSVEGKCCVRCGTFSHIACAPADKCDACGEALEGYEPPRADPMRQAVLPPGLRPPRDGGPVLALAALGLSLVFLACYVLQTLTTGD
jgi:hypothetical protein